MCGCSNKSNCGCESINSGDTKFDGQNFVCEDSLSQLLFEIESGENMNNVLLTVFTQLCILLNRETPTSGSIWYSDIGLPATDLGNENDFYLRQSNGDVYQKEDPASWGSPITNLKGVSGTDGANGTSFRFGAGVPADTLGLDGDSYVDTSVPTIKLYTKAAGTWSDSGLTLKGEQGDAGTNGTDGTNGTNGTDGSDGFSFRQGVGVPLVSLGNDGDSYLDSANGDIYLKGGGSWSVTGNIYNGPTGLEFLFNAGKITEQSVVGANNTVQLAFADDVSAGRFDYGNTWTSDQQKMPSDTDNLSYRGIFNLRVTGVDGGSDNDVTVSVRSNGALIQSFTIPVPAGTVDDTIIPLSFATANAFYSQDRIITVEMSTANDPVYNSFVGVLEVGSVFYNVQG